MMAPLVPGMMGLKTHNELLKRGACVNTSLEPFCKQGTEKEQKEKSLDNCLGILHAWIVDGVPTGNVTISSAIIHLAHLRQIHLNTIRDYEFVNKGQKKSRKPNYVSRFFLPKLSVESLNTKTSSIKWQVQEKSGPTLWREQGHKSIGYQLGSVPMVPHIYIESRGVKGNGENSLH